MAIAHSMSELTTSQTPHHYTVGYVPNGGHENPAPAITLKGRWLEQAGFTRGTPIMVTVVNGHLVITPLPRQSLMNNMLPKIAHLSEASQQQLAHIINGLMVQDHAASYGDRAAKRKVRA